VSVTKVIVGVLPWLKFVVEYLLCPLVPTSFTVAIKTKLY